MGCDHKSIALVMVRGPVCAGKSTLSGRAADALRYRHLEMDAFRNAVFKDCGHTRPAIDKAYLCMHICARLLLSSGVGVVLDSTYSREDQRQDVQLIADEFRVPLLIFECRVGPQEAVRRYLNRNSPHAAEDLTPDRVALLANTYKYSPAAFQIDAERAFSECLNDMLAVIQDVVLGFDGGEILSRSDC
jgi:predicted kinase